MMPVTDNSDELKPHQKPPETTTISPEDPPALRNHWNGMQGATCDPFFENHHKMAKWWLSMVLYGYESKPWYPSEPQITAKWMFIPPNIARLVLIHPHIGVEGFPEKLMLKTHAKPLQARVCLGSVFRQPLQHFAHLFNCMTS